MFRILAFTLKPCEAPDTRFRILQYRELAEKDGIQVDHYSLIGPTYYHWQRRNVQLPGRVLLYPFLLARRLWQVLFEAPKYDAIWISREMAPFGPPILERLLIRRCKRVILDIDDAMHISDKESSRLIPRLLRDNGKFGRMAASYTTIVCGNRYLADYYEEHAATVEVLPTVVNTKQYTSIRQIGSDIVRIGWIGTPLNRYHLETVRTALSELAKERRFELIVVGLNEPLNWDSPLIRHIKWQLKDELNYFAQFDIGIMPLKDSAFSRGKCAFKLIQYMAAGLPVVASPVGANSEVVSHNRNGFLARNDEDWVSMLRTLIDDPVLRCTIGEAGQKLVQRRYCTQVVWPRYAEILTGAESKRSVFAASDTAGVQMDIQ